MKKLLIGIFLLSTVATAQQLISDLTAKKLQVVSTTTGSKPCPLMTQTQRDAIVSPLNGQCLYNTTTSKLNVYNGTVWKAAGGGVDAWATSTIYAVNDLVIQSNRIYIALIAHTSGTFATDLAALKWEEISSMTGVDLTTNQTIGGVKTFSNTIVGSVNGNAATVTTNANLTGAVISTGNASLLGSFSSSNLLTALSDKTGTGLSVFQTSPTLVTPEIGVATGSSLALGGSLTAGTIISASSTTAAVIFPRMTTTQKNALTPVAGMEVYDSTINAKQYYNGSQWVANTSIQLDNVYSAQSTSGGVISSENVGFINGNGVVSDTSLYTFTLDTGKLTTTPNCGAFVVNGAVDAAFQAKLVSASSTTIVVRTGYTDATNNFDKSAVPFNIICQKSSPDYQSADAYIASNGNYGWTAYTPTFTGFGTVTSPDCWYRREGSDLLLRCNRIIVGTSTAVEARISLPNSLVIDSSIGTNSPVAEAYRNASTTVNFGWSVLAASGLSYVTFGTQSSTANKYSSVQGSALVVSGEIFGFHTARIPIAGWSTSNLIVASLAGTPNVPGLATAVDTFSVSYGTTNAGTVCSASPCSYLDQIGTTVSSITRSGTGAYAINTARTYAKLKCIIGTNNVSDPAQCSSCSTVSFTSKNTTTGAAADSLGVINCVGSY